jgi:hypothetical protein
MLFRTPWKTLSIGPLGYLRQYLPGIKEDRVYFGVSGPQNRPYFLRTVGYGFKPQGPMEIATPTARMASIKTIFALAVIMGLKVRFGDVPGAYLQAPIGPKTKVYMQQLEGFVQEGKERHWMKLKQVVYGLPMEGQLWHSVMMKFLIFIGLNKTSQTHVSSTNEKTQTSWSSL